MFRRLVTLALLTFAFGVAVSKPSPAALACGCGSCWRYPTGYCYDEFISAGIAKTTSLDSAGPNSVLAV